MEGRNCRPFWVVGVVEFAAKAVVEGFCWSLTLELVLMETVVVSSFLCDGAICNECKG